MILRQALPADAEGVRAVYAPYVRTTAITFDDEVPTAGQMAQRIAAAQQAGYPFLVAEQGGVVVGYACAGPLKPRHAYRWCVETSIYLALTARNRGVGSVLHAALERELLRLGVTSAYACITHSDGSDPRLPAGSEQFHARLGYELVGRFPQCGYKLGRWWDVVWMRKQLRQATANPPQLGLGGGSSE